jgi:hypothetical protein
MMSGTYSNPPFTKKGYKIFPFFYETRIPTVNMNVQVYYKFSKNKIWKKIKYPSSMRNGRFDTPKCKGKVQKLEVLCTHAQSSPGPCKITSKMFAMNDLI